MVAGVLLKLLCQHYGLVATLYDDSIMINDNVMINKCSDSSIINPLFTPIDPQIAGDGDSDLHVTS